MHHKLLFIEYFIRVNFPVLYILLFNNTRIIFYDIVIYFDAVGIGVHFYISIYYPGILFNIKIQEID